MIMQLPIDRAFYEVMRALHSFGRVQPSRNGNTRELLGYSQSIDPHRCWLSVKRRHLDPHYACAETLWYLTGAISPALLLPYAPQYQNFSNNGYAYGAYGSRVLDQLNTVAEILKRDPDSRQAIVSLWEKNDLDRARRDLPCTLVMQFLVRDGELIQIVTMRSNDLWLGLPYDVFAFCCIGHILANMLGIKFGRYHHQAGSLHLYEKHWHAADESQMSTVNTLRLEWDTHDPQATFANALVHAGVLLEAATREPYSIGRMQTIRHHCGHILGDLVLTAASKFVPEYRISILSPPLREAVDAYADYRRDRSSGKDNLSPEVD